MHVLYFHQHFSTPKGSTGIRSYEMAKKLVNNGHKVTMVCGSYGGGNTGIDTPFVNGIRRGVVDNINVVEFELEYSNEQSFMNRSMAFLKFALKSVKLALTEKYDLIFATTTPLTASIPGVFAKLLRKKPFIFEVRDLWPEIPKEMGVIRNPVVLFCMAILEKVSYKSADALIGLSPGIKRGIERHDINPDNVAMIPNGCDLQIFGSNEHKWQPDGVNDDDLLAVFTGTHGIANGLDAVINAAAELKARKVDNIKFVLIGRGIKKKELLEAAEKQLLDNIVFLEPVDKEKLAKLLARADVGMQILKNTPAFYYGTSPNKFFDYIAAGKPVLNNYPGWVADLLREYHCGKAIAPDDPIAFADAMEWFSNNRSSLPEMGLNARKLAMEKFDRDKLSDQFVDWLEKWSS